MILKHELEIDVYPGGKNMDFTFTTFCHTELYKVDLFNRNNLLFLNLALL